MKRCDLGDGICTPPLLAGLGNHDSVLQPQMACCNHAQEALLETLGCSGAQRTHVRKSSHLGRQIVPSVRRAQRPSCADLRGSDLNESQGEKAAGNNGGPLKSLYASWQNAEERGFLI